MYLYFDYKGTLLETVNDQALRQYNKGVNTVNIYIESEPDSVTGIVPDDGKIPSYITGIDYWFQLANGDKLNSTVYNTSSKIKKTIPFDRNRDLKHFRYGKSYEFFSFQVPSGDYKREENDNVIDFVGEGDVFKSSGLVLMTVQALTMETNADGTQKEGALSLERVAFTVEDAVILPDDIVSSSEFNWLLQQYAFGDYLRAQLVYMKVDKITSSHAFTIDGDKYSIDLDTSLFNRQPPKIGDAFLYVYENGADKGSNITMAAVGNITGDVTTCSFSISNTISIKGEKGDTGEKALTYWKEIDQEFVVGTIFSLETNWFSRLPNAQEAFIAFNTQNQYALLRVTGDAPSYLTDTKVVPEYVVNTKGEKGDNGDDGKSTLIYSDILNVNTEPTYDSTYWGLNKNYFNREPQEGESFLLLIRYITDNSSYIATASVRIQGSQYGAHLWRAPLDTQGTPGKDGTNGTNGKDGEKGDTGEIALVYNSIFSADSIENINFHSVASLAHFNRTPHDGDSCIVIWNNTTDNKTYILTTILKEDRYGYALDTEKTTQQIITGPVGPMGTVFVPSISKTGDISWTNDGGLDNPETVNVKGDTGEVALVYKTLYDTAFSNSTAALILKFNGFNRIPKADDRFILFSTQSKYASCYVAGVNAESEEATCYFTDVVDTKGLPGATGSTGATGKVALMFKSTFVLTNAPSYYVDGGHSFTWTGDVANSFNRTPETSDIFIAIATYGNYQYVVTASATGTNHNVIFLWSYASIMGETGASGVGISSASVKSTSETEEYTSTTVSFAKTDSTTSEVVIKAKNGINPNTVSFIGTVAVSDWQNSTAYSAYGYKYSALMPFTGGVYATDTYVPDVVPSAVADVVSGNFAPFANSLSTGVQIYAKTKPTATTNFNVSLSHVQ